MPRWGVTRIHVQLHTAQMREFQASCLQRRPNHGQPFLISSLWSLVKHHMPSCLLIHIPSSIQSSSCLLPDTSLLQPTTTSTTCIASVCKLYLSPHTNQRSKPVLTLNDCQMVCTRLPKSYVWKLYPAVDQTTSKSSATSVCVKASPASSPE
jgi:hypothetical protein